MPTPEQSVLMSGISKLKRFGTARDRRYEHTGREVILTDDEAVAILNQLPAALVRAATRPKWDTTASELPVVHPTSDRGLHPDYREGACICRNRRPKSSEVHPECPEHARRPGQFGPWGPGGRQGS